MFVTTNPFCSLQSDSVNKPVFNFHANNKENYIPFAQHKPQHHRQHSRSDFSQLSNPTYNPGLNYVSNSQEFEAGTLPILNKRGISSQSSNDKICMHQSTRQYKRTYCKDCGIFFPSSGAEAYKEQIFKQNLDSHPDEVYKIMLANQEKNREYVQGSLHMKHRKTLIDWISKIGEELHFFCDTIYTAISYLDTILLHIQIPRDKLQLICVCCLITAAKFCEREEKVPTYKEIYEHCLGIYSIELLKRTERYVLGMLDWNLKTITPFQFIQFYLSKGCAFSTDNSVIRDIDSKLLRYLRKYAEFFVDISVQNYDFNSYKSNIIACAAISAARKAVGLMPIWTSELEELTEVSWSEIEVCFTLLYSSFEANFPEIAKKANSCIDQSQNKKDEVEELEKSYAAMTIESATSTPFRQSNWRENHESDSSGSKKERPQSSAENKNSKGELPAAEQVRDAVNQEKIKNLEIKMGKKFEGSNMSIENAGDSGVPVKRNLIF